MNIDWKNEKLENLVKLIKEGKNVPAYNNFREGYQDLWYGGSSFTDKKDETVVYEKEDNYRFVYMEYRELTDSQKEEYLKWISSGG